MVSAKNIITIAAILGAAAAFVSLGGASGIGKRIGESLGGGFNAFGSSFISGFSNLSEQIGSATTGGQSQNSNVGKSTLPPEKLVDGVNTAEDVAVQKGEKANQGVIPLSLSFKEALLDKEISQDFAQRFSFLEPPKIGSGVLDVSKTFSFLSETEGASVKIGSFRGTQFGGYANPQAQEAALVAAIERQSQLTPQFFG